MKKFKSKYIIGIIFVCIIAFFFGSVCYRVYRVKRYNDYGTVTSETDASGNDKQESYDWASEYTFSEKYDCKTVKSIEKSSDKESTAEKNTNETSEKGYLSVAQQFKDSVDAYSGKNEICRSKCTF